ncbi:MAG: hypothetical protein H7Z43_05975 [Clostridia bacterium]|nr:hypothetical protein [Deltaproteobacteria bacterium]
MFSLLKFFMFLGLAGAAIYCVFFAEYHGKPMASHVSEVWDSDLVQKKIESMKRDVRDDLEERLAKAKAEKAASRDKLEKNARADGKTVSHDGHDYVTEADRESLTSLIEKKARAK